LDRIYGPPGIPYSVEYSEAIGLAYRLADEVLEADKPVEEVDYARAGVAGAMARLGRHGEAMAIAASIRGRGLRAYTLATIAEASRQAFLDAAALAEEEAEGLPAAQRLYVEARLAEAEYRWGHDPVERLGAAARLLPEAGWRGAARLAVAYAACGMPGYAVELAGGLPGPRERGYALSEAAYAMRSGDRGFLEAVYREVSGVPDGGLRYMFLSRALGHERLVDPGLARVRAEGLVEAVARMRDPAALYVQPVVVGNIYEAGLGEQAEAAAGLLVEELAGSAALLTFEAVEALTRVALYYLGPEGAWRVAGAAGGAVGLAAVAAALDSWTRAADRLGW